MERFEAYDENGKKIIFELVETFGMNDSEYAVLNSEDDVNTYILKIIYDNTEYFNPKFVTYCKNYYKEKI